MAVRRRVKRVEWWSCGRCDAEHKTKALAEKCASRERRQGPDLQKHYRRWHAHVIRGKSYAAIGRKEGRGGQVVKESCRKYPYMVGFVMPMSRYHWHHIACYGTTNLAKIRAIKSKQLPRSMWGIPWWPSYFTPDVLSDPCDVENWEDVEAELLRQAAAIAR